MPYQTVTLTSRDDQIVVRTPWGESFVVSAQIVGDRRHIYITPPENYERRDRPASATTMFERVV